MAQPNSKAPVGQGGRFAALEYKLSQRPGVHDPQALTAFIGRKKYGKAGFQKLSKRKKHKLRRDSAGDTYAPGARFDSRGDRIMGKRDSRGDRL